MIGEAVRSIERPPPVWVQMSTAHIYGDPPREVCSEDSAVGYGLAPEVGRAWEAAFHDGILPTQRGVILRTSFVLGRNRGAGAGALGKLARLARWGLGGRVGHGRQGISWIHERDMNRLFHRALTEPSMRGVYVASAPHPVSQCDFMRHLRAAVRRPFGLPVAAWMTQLGARFVFRTDPDLALYGRYVVSRRLEREGFSFEFPKVADALKSVLTSVD